MEINMSDLLNSMLQNLSSVDFIKSSDIPNIDLYMDQVTSFMEKQLGSTKRYPEDKVLTKTMINNYAKNDLLPAPNKKKYSKEHLLVLTFIYYFKNILSMKDIETLLAPITQKHFHTDNPVDIARIYDEVCISEKDRTKMVQSEIESLYASSMQTFTDVDTDDKEMLQIFSFICSLSLDVYMKKMLIEKLIDAIPEPEKANKKEVH